MPFATLDEILAAADEALRAAPPGDAPYALFDADDTLWATDVSFRLYDALHAAHAIRPTALAVLNQALAAAGLAPMRDATAASLAMFDAYGRGVLDETTAFETMITALAGHTAASLGEALDCAIGPAGRWPVADSVYREIPMIFTALRGLGFKIAVVSASPGEAVRFGLRAAGLEADRVRGGETERDGETFSDRLIRPMTYREGKLAAALADWGHPPTIGFGDSRGDAPFLARARVAVCVNPRPALVEASQNFAGRVLHVRFEHTVSGRAVTQPTHDTACEPPVKC